MLLLFIENIYSHFVLSFYNPACYNESIASGIQDFFIRIRNIIK